MSKFQWIAVVLAVIFLAALFGFGAMYLKQENERLRLLWERVAGLYTIEPPDISATPEPTPTVIPPKTSDFTDAKPDDELTRAMFTAMLAALEGVDLSAYTKTRFDDVPEDEWYSAAVTWAADMGIATGIGGGLFAPDAPILREQIAVMLCNYMKNKKISMATDEAPAITDYEEVCDWAFESVDAVRAAGIVPDRPDGTFDPHGKVTNAEADAIFERILSIKPSPDPPVESPEIPEDIEYPGGQDLDDYGDWLPPYEPPETEPAPVYRNETIIIPTE